jgi:adenylate cyclase
VKLELVKADGGQVFPLPEGQRVVVGRSAACELPLFEGTISRRHAEVVADGGTATVRDLGSTNGSFVNGHRVAETMRAQPGDVVTFGQVVFRLRAAEAAAAPGRDAAAPGPAAAEPPAAEPPAAEPDASGLEIRRRLPIDSRPAPPGKAADSRDSLLHLVGASVQERQARRLSVLLEISKALAGQIEVDRLLERVVEITFQVMSVDRVAVLLYEPGGGAMVPRAARTRDGKAWGAKEIPRSILNRAVAERAAILSGNAAADARFSTESILLHRVESAMCAPLAGSGGGVLGVLYVDNQTAIHSFTDEDLEFLIAFSGIAALALENSRLIERVRREAVVLSNFQRYFAPDLAQQIAAQEAAVVPGGEKRRVAILFSDIRGFTALSERMSPDETASLLNEYFTEMVQVVFEHGGTLDKFIGDAVMALWGAPFAHGDDAERAVAAAVAMQRVLAELNRAWQRQGRPPLAVGIGLSLGEVFAGNIGSDRRLEYTVIGDEVNTAARLCAQAGAGEVLATEPVLAALRTARPAEALAPLALKGKAAPTPVYRLRWEEATPAPEST